MNIRNVYKLTGLICLYLLFQSRSGGPGSVANLQVTGAPGSTGTTGTCANAGCHTAGAFDPTLSIALLDGTTPVNEYNPGKSYLLRITNTPGTGTPSRYGFQAVALDSTNQQAGDWGNPGAGKHVVTLSNRRYVEHSAPSPSGQFEIPWIAPPAGAGNVTFYSASLAANNNGNNSGDGMAKNTLTIVEGAVLATGEPPAPTVELAALHNPIAAGELELKLRVLQPGAYQLLILDLNGRTLLKENLPLAAGDHTHTLDVTALPAGIYTALLHSRTRPAAIRFIKL